MIIFGYVFALIFWLIQGVGWCILFLLKAIVFLLMLPFKLLAGKDREV